MTPRFVSYACCGAGRMVARQPIALSQIDSFRHVQISDARIDHVSWSFHRSQVHARQILTDDADGKELCPGKYRNDRRQEREPWNRAALDQIPDNNVRKDQESK